MFELRNIFKLDLIEICPVLVIFNGLTLWKGNDSWLIYLTTYSFEFILRSDKNPHAIAKLSLG